MKRSAGSWIELFRQFRFAALILAVLAVPVAALPKLQTASADWLAEYTQSPASDAIAHLQERMDSGDVKFEFDANWGYLPSVLKSLKIPASSQSLVYSKTSFQLDKIAPWSPRAIYFNDDVYVGWVQGGTVIEVASVDPNLGAVFYTLDQTSAPKPKFQRQVSNCLQCHDSMLNTGGVPGFVVQSVYVDRYGYPLPSSHNPVSTDKTPLGEKFGGWYVSGTSGGQVHMGNFVAPKAAGEIGNPQVYLANLDLKATGNVTDLSKFFRNDHYLARTSDIVALSLLIHQASLHTAMIQATYDPRVDGPNSKAEALVRALLFSREAPLTAPIKGSPEFIADFSKAGPRDHRGRSLRDLDLNTRLLKYPLSYLIYSKGFDGLPANVKTYVAKRLSEILTGRDNSPAFAYLSPADRQAVLEILQDTKPGFLEAVTRE